MNASQIWLRGMLTLDGTLELEQRPKLPAGPVDVLIRAHPPSNGDHESWLAYLLRSHEEAVAQGSPGRSQKEIEGERALQRAKDEERRQSIQRIQKPGE